MAFTRLRIGATILAFAAVASACGSCDSPSHNAAAPSATAHDTSQSPSTTGSPEIPAGWATYESKELGISFRYPRIPGTVEMRSGAYGSDRERFAWVVERSDACTDGVCRSYEFAALNDTCPPSEGWPTYAHEWFERGGRYYLNSCGGTDPFEVTPLRIVTRSDGLRGVIYDANVWMDPGRIPGAMAAVLNLPAGYNATLEAIAFYFEDPTPTTDVELVLRSVRLNR